MRAPCNGSCTERARLAAAAGAAGSLPRAEEELVLRIPRRTCGQWLSVGGTAANVWRDDGEHGGGGQYVRLRVSPPPLLRTRQHALLVVVCAATSRSSRPGE